MIRVTIERLTEVKYVERKSMITHEEPTEIQEDSGYTSGRKTVTYKKDYAVTDVPMVRTETSIVLRQEMDDDEFHLKDVVRALNNLT